MIAWAGARDTLARRREQILYVLVGGWNTLFGYGAFALFYHLLHDTVGLSRVGGSMTALVASTVVGVINNYVLYRTVVFRSHGPVRREVPRFLVVYAAVLVVNLIVLPVAVRALPFSVYLIQAVFTVSVVVSTYVANKYFSFAPAGRRPPGGASTPNGTPGVSR